MQPCKVNAARQSILHQPDLYRPALHNTMECSSLHGSAYNPYPHKQMPLKGAWMALMHSSSSCSNNASCFFSTHPLTTPSPTPSPVFPRVKPPFAVVPATKPRQRRSPGPSPTPARTPGPSPSPRPTGGPSCSNADKRLQPTPGPKAPRPVASPATPPQPDLPAKPSPSNLSPALVRLRERLAYVDSKGGRPLGAPKYSKSPLKYSKGLAQAPAEKRSSEARD